MCSRPPALFALHGHYRVVLVRYMSTRDAGEQRSLLRVISTMLQLTKDEVTAVEARIAELERTMVNIKTLFSIAAAVIETSTAHMHAFELLFRIYLAQAFCLLWCM